MTDLGIMCISLTNTKYAVENFSYGESSVQIISETVKEKFNNSKIINYIHSEMNGEEIYKKSFSINEKITPDIYTLLNDAKEKFKDCENIVIIHTDEPLVDFSLLDDLILLHKENIADYTMTENYPEGVSPVIISYDTLTRLSMITSGNNEVYNKNSIYKIIEMDINSYDIELLVCEHDMRRDRLELFADTKRNFLICGNILKELNGKEKCFSNIFDIIKNKPEVMRTLPAYIEIEITGKCELNCVMCPRENTGRTETFMKYEDYKKIVDDIEEFCEDAVICISGMGEPFLHPDILKMIEYTINKNEIKLIAETSGKNLTPEISDKLLAIFNQRFHLIFSIEALDEEKYKEIRGSNDFKNIEKNIDYYISKKSENTFLQFVKMDKTENFIDDFYERWKKYEERIILLKYNDYREELPKDSSHNIAPIKRFPCWHLKRDMYINSRCDVVLCKQDYKGSEVYGNAVKDGISTCFKSIQDFYVNDYLNGPEEYCKKCDEYFTYNF